MKMLQEHMKVTGWSGAEGMRTNGKGRENDEDVGVHEEDEYKAGS